MYSLAYYLDDIKKMKQLETDADLARFLKVSRSHISQLRSGSHMGELKCFELAKTLKIEPLEILSLNRAIRNNERKLADYWYKVHLNSKNTTI